ncbi:hypothetical protein HG530_010069 [Fusarium avenaceum]|nr:hypothetical protein HG530_010069 [Fusarium avenaceum]
MSAAITITQAHIPLLESFITVLSVHVDDLLVRLSRLHEVRDHMPEHQHQNRQNMGFLIQQCSMELNWAIKNRNIYMDVRNMAHSQPQQA